MESHDFSCRNFPGRSMDIVMTTRSMKKILRARNTSGIFPSFRIEHGIKHGILGLAL